MNTAQCRQRSQAEDCVLAGGGVMGALMRTHDWASSLLGPVSDWPQSLRTTVSLALNSQFPTIIFWGPDLIMLYNDAYLPIADDKHPAALGRPAREFWSEVWSLAGPMLHGVLATGEATWSSDLLLPIVHNGSVGEHYFTFSYSPIRDETGAIRGVFCPVTETTARVQQERREQRLREEAETARDQVTLVLESMHDSFVAFDEQWRITTINASAATAMRQHREELLGKVYWDAFPAARDTNLYPQFHRAMAERMAVEFESYYPPWQCWYDVRVYPTVTGGLSVFFRDITERKQAEVALHEREERLRLALDAAHMVAWEWDAETEAVMQSPNADRVMGLPGRLLTSRHEFFALVHPEDRPRLLETLQASLREQTPYVLEFRLCCPDGVTRWMEDHGSPRRSASGLPTSISGVIVDITARKHTEDTLRESEARFRALASASPGMVWTATPDGTIIYANDQWLQFCGLSQDENRYAWPQLVLHPDDTERCLTQWTQALRAGTPYEIEVRNRRHDGVYRWLLTRALPVRDAAGRITAWYGTTMDIHERKEAEAERERLLIELQRVNEELQQFAYIVSHDLNEPLRTMRNFVQLLARHAAGKPDHEAQEYMAFITDAAQRLQQMLADLLAYTRTGQTPERQAVDSEEVLAQILSRLQTQITDCGAVITHDPLPTIQGDATRLGQVLQNLIGNALKFRSDTLPRIHVSVVKKHDHWLFSVRDNGIGIEPQQVNKLFQVFQRAHGKEYAGTGIGLAICKKIVEQHGGCIWVESQPNEGTIFYFTLAEQRSQSRQGETGSLSH